MSDFMEIINITATVIMEKLFDLDNLQKDLPNSEKTHVWVKARIPPYEKYTAFYGSGKFLVTGVKSYDELNRVANNVVSYLKKYGIKNEIREIQINNHVLTDEMNTLINLNDLVVKLNSNNVSYEPEQFPGLIYKDENNITFMLFSSGKINITGIKSIENIDEKINSFKQLIYEKSSEDQHGR